MPKTKHFRKPVQKGRPKKVRCTALIHLNTAKIRRDLLESYQKKKKELEILDAQIARTCEIEEPAFKAFAAIEFGAAMTRLREVIEKNLLLKTRIDKLYHMADRNYMSPQKYCHHLKSKVTDSTDIWTVLDNEIQELHNKATCTKEEFDEMEREFMDEEFDEFDDETFADPYDNFDDIDDEFDDEFDDIFEEDPQSPFSQFFANLFPKHKKNEDEEKALKKLYRELCSRHHPDKIGQHDAKMQRLWHSIQEAYEHKDLQRLRAIHADLELASGKSELRCSDIHILINDTIFEIDMNRKRINHLKKEPHWNFSSTTDKQRQKIKRRCLQDINSSISMNEYEYDCHEMEIKRLMNAYPPRKKTKTAKSSKQVPKKKNCEQKIQMDFDI